MTSAETILADALLDAVRRDPLLVHRLPQRVIDGIDLVEARRAHPSSHAGRGNWAEVTA